MKKDVKNFQLEVKVKSKNNLEVKLIGFTGLYLQSEKYSMVLWESEEIGGKVVKEEPIKVQGETFTTTFRGEEIDLEKKPYTLGILLQNAAGKVTYCPVSVTLEKGSQTGTYDSRNQVRVIVDQVTRRELGITTSVPQPRKVSSQPQFWVLLEGKMDNDFHKWNVNTEWVMGYGRFEKADMQPDILVKKSFRQENWYCIAYIMGDDPYAPQCPDFTRLVACTNFKAPRR